MRYLYLNGLLIAEDKYISITFKESDTASTVVTPDINSRSLLVEYPIGATNSSIVFNGITTIIDNDIQSGTYILRKSVVLNGLRYIMTNNTVNNIRQFIISPDILTTDGYALSDDQLIIALKSDSELLTDVNKYRELVNSSGYVYIPSTDITNWKFTNFYMAPVDDEELNSIDVSVAGDQPTFELDAATNCKGFINKLKSTYPEISFFTSEVRRDTNKDEYIQYEFKLDSVSNGYHTPIMQSDFHGKYWYTTIPVILEYSTTDYMKFIARRSSYLSNEFLVQITNSDITVGNMTFTSAIFWERNDVTQEPTAEVSLDKAQYKLYGFQIRSTIYCPIAQYSNHSYPTIIKVISQIINSKFAS